MPNTYLIIGVLLLALAGAGTFGYHQTKQVGKLEVSLEAKNTEIEKRDATIVSLREDVARNVEKSLWHQREQQRIQQESDKVQQQAMKDVSRVEAIAKKKAKLYEKIINNDYRKTQREIEELTK